LRRLRSRGMGILRACPDTVKRVLRAVLEATHSPSISADPARIVSGNRGRPCRRISSAWGAAAFSPPLR